MISNLLQCFKTHCLLVLVFMTTAFGFSQGAETFNNIPANANNYATRVWTGDNGEIWTAEKARTDQSINGRALAFTDVANATLTTTILGGIGDLTLTTQRIFAGTSGTVSVSVGGVIVGNFPYSASVQTTTISGINTAGDVVLVLKTDGNNKVAIDDVIWTAGPAEENTPPMITNIQRDIEYVTPTDEVVVTADITDSDGVASAELHWGAASGVLTNTITMTNNGAGNNYSIATAIPAHVLGTTIYFVIEATDSNVVPATAISAEMSYTVMEDLGVDNNNLLTGIRLYPNPVTDDTFYIHAPKLNGQHVKLKITDVSGRQIFNETLKCKDSKLAVSVNNIFTSGVYLVTLNVTGETSTYRLVKQ